MIAKVLYYARWFYKCKLAGQKIPLNGSVILTDKCNLACKHCVVAHLGYQDFTFDSVTRDIDSLYATGSRMLVITGGEPFLWRDKDRYLEDVVMYAKKKGFFRVVICTNGTFPLESSADYLWVSLDGASDEHDRLRGNIHSEVVRNIITSPHKNIYINYTISTLNADDLEKNAQAILRIKNIRGILFHLFTPYLASDVSLTLSSIQRRQVIGILRKIKARHPMRVSNTFAGLSALQSNSWTRNFWASVTICNGEISQCCCRRGIYDANVCRQCGCTPAVETWVLTQASLLTVAENLRFL